MDSYGHWENTGRNGQPVGYTCLFDHQEGHDTLLTRTKDIFLFVLHPEHPLTYCHQDGRRYRTCRAMMTDKGTIPWWLQWRYPIDETIAYFLHDSGYLERGLWVAEPTSDIFVFQSLDRVDIDDLLHDGYLGEFGNTETRHKRADQILAGVRSFGWLPWFGRTAEMRAKWVAQRVLKEP